VTITPDTQKHLLHVEVVVNWTGSDQEMEEGGYGTELKASYDAYSLNTVVAKQYDEAMITGAPAGVGP